MCKTLLKILLFLSLSVFQQIAASINETKRHGEHRIYLMGSGRTRALNLRTYIRVVNSHVSIKCA